jgi:hypothetical protein
MKIQNYVDGSGHMYNREVNTVECPVCHKQVEYLLGEDEGGTQEDRGRKGCEECWRPFKYGKGEVYRPESPSTIFEGLGQSGPVNAESIIADLRREA